MANYVNIPGIGTVYTKPSEAKQEFVKTITQPSQQQSKPAPKNYVTGNKNGGTGGGGGSSISSPSPTATPVIVGGIQTGIDTGSKSIMISPQKQSQQSQDQALDLQRQNVATQRNAIQRDQNYILANFNTGSKSAMPYQTKGTQMLQSSFKYEGPPISLGPTIYQKQTGTFLDTSTGKSIPLTETRYNAGLLNSGLIVEDRPVTKSEADYFKQQTSVLQASTKSPSKASREFGETLSVIKQDVYKTNVEGKGFLTQFGITESSINKGVQMIPTFAAAKKAGEMGIPGAKAFNEFGTNLVSAPIKSVYQEPLTNVATFAVGYGIGLGASTIGAGIESAAFNVGSKFGTGAAIKSGLYAKRGVNLVGLGGGTIFAISEVSTTFNKIAYIKNASEFGSVVGLESLRLGEAFGGAYLGTKSAGKVVDVFRTRGLSELPAESIVAPEFYKGQKYPQLSKGQTAGQLKSEFYVSKLPNEIDVAPRAFTASPGDFSKNAITQKGSSEVSGLYGSADLSPAFLKVGGTSEKAKTFSIDIAPSNPTAIRLNLRDVEYAPGITSSTSKIGGNPKEFFESIGGSGRSVIPFMKTEKEVVTAFDTPIKQFAEDYFIPFEGRRVPIKQFEIDLNGAGKSISKDSFGLGKTSSYYSGSISSSYITPSSGLSLGYSGYSKSSSKLSMSSVGYPKSSIGYLGSSKSSSLSSKSITNSSYGLSSSISSKGLSSSNSMSSSSSSSLSGVSFSGYSGGGSSGLSYKKSSYPFTTDFEFGRKKKNKKKKDKMFVSEFNIAPSFTAIVENLKMSSPLKVSKTFGVTPFQTRGLLVGKKGKPGAGPYFKLTDI
jgi:hypothetical protein